MTKVQKATHEGILPVGELQIHCAVLKDGTRVISERGISKALGTKRGGSHWRRKKEGENLPVYISAGNLEPFLDTELRAQLTGLIKYQGRRGAIANGLEATILPKICDVYLKARDAGAILPSQAHIDVGVNTLPVEPLRGDYTSSQD